MDNLSYDKKRPTFGTGGIRAVMGFGSECFNAGLVRAATIGAARWANEKYGDDAMKLGFVVCCDTRNHSTAYAHLCADVLSIAGFRSRIFKQPTPTPLLSYAIRRFGACAGIAITASHNAAAYNGFKVYDATGNQLTPDDTALIARKTDDFLLDGVDRLPQRIYSEVTVIGPSLLEEYISKVIASFPAATNPEKLRIVYTPLFGAGRLAVSKILTSAGFSDLLLVATQMKENGDFPGLAAPNPEDEESLESALMLGLKRMAALAIATDPDCDRIAVCARRGYNFDKLTGSELGALLCDYVTRNFKWDDDRTPVVLKTVVTGELGAKIARSRGFKVRETLTGFKYIGALINELEQSETERFAFAYEESCGYLATSLVRDKDGISSSLLACLTAAECLSRNQTLFDHLKELNEQFGYTFDSLETVETFSGSEIMRTLRERPLFNNCEIDDYSVAKGGLPSADLLKYRFSDGSVVAVRPSGTEPKLKIYCFAAAPSEDAAKLRHDGLIAEIKEAVL